MLGKIEGRKRREQKRMKWLDGITDLIRLDGQEFERAPGAGDGEGSLVYYSAWGRKELDTNQQLN